VRAIIASEVPNEFTSIAININPASETTRTNPTSITFFYPLIFDFIYPYSIHHQALE
jgi:hypothetical protein